MYSAYRLKSLAFVNPFLIYERFLSIARFIAMCMTLQTSLVGSIGFIDPTRFILKGVVSG